MGLENYPTAADFQNVKESFGANLNWLARTVLFRKFLSYSTTGTGMEQFRRPVFDERTEEVWLANITAFDTTRGGYFTTGDLDVNVPFQMRGFTPAYTLEDGTVIAEYGGDEMIWNGKVWVPSDQIEPKSIGPKLGIVFWRTVLRASNRSGAGLTEGIK